MPVKISPKPARIAPDDRSRPFAISQRKAPIPSMGRATDETLTPKAEQRHHPGRRGRPERGADDDPDRLRQGDQSRADEADDGEACRGRGLDRRREQHAGHDRAETAADQPLQGAAQRVARETLQAFGEVVDPEQEQAQSTHERYGGGGVDGRASVTRAIAMGTQYFAATNRLPSIVAWSS